jgi:hypothetical protein
MELRAEQRTRTCRGNMTGSPDGAGSGWTDGSGGGDLGTRPSMAAPGMGHWGAECNSRHL